SHRSFSCPRWLERCFVVVAVCCMEDAPAVWVSAHRLHHKDSDERPDPHSPLVNFLWSHVGWLLFPNHDVRSFNACDRYARDIIRDPFYLWLQLGINVMLVYLAHAALFFLVGLGAGAWMTGTWMGGLQFGLSMLVWGVILRTVVVWHITWSVNSLTHLWGYRNYDTGEESRNNWFVGLIANGEGWHNNHHAEPASASNWHRWWEIDPMWLVIRGLERVGLAWDVVRPRHQRHEIRKAK
ncbi:MAG: acyl-CoA desaturase, partial [Aeoliella sp.]